MARAAKHVLNLVANELLDLRAGRPQVFARVEFFGVFGKRLANGRGHGQAKVGIDVHLGASGPARDFDVGFRYAGGVGAQLAAIFIDFLSQILGDAGGAVQHQRVIAQSSLHQGGLDRLEAVEIKVLFALELVGAVRIADGHRQ